MAGLDPPSVELRPTAVERGNRLRWAAQDLAQDTGRILDIQALRGRDDQGSGNHSTSDVSTPHTAPEVTLDDHQAGELEATLEDQVAINQQDALPSTPAHHQVTRRMDDRQE